jgi:succinoglycan biosynthesis protein ExoL
MSESQPIRIAYFGHDAADAAIKRRVTAFLDDGFQVDGYMMQRRDPGDLPWRNVKLGETRDAAFIQRFRSLFFGSQKAAKHADQLAKADFICARNLDMLAVAFLTKRKLKLKTPVIYESLDVHRMLSRSDPIGALMRWIERQMLKRTTALIVSSPGFLTHYFERYHRSLYKPILIENRLAAGTDYGDRPAESRLPNDRPLQIGWVGMLRCKRSLDLLAIVADRLKDRVEIHLHGIPARSEIDVFEPIIDQRDNMIFHGRYKSPEDLSSIYSQLDVVWAGDFMEAGENSVWLLPNRIYEGGYYGVPSIAPAKTQTAAWVAQHDVGFVVEEDLEQKLADLIEALASDRSQIEQFRANLLSISSDVFVQPKGFLSRIFKAV